MENLDVAERYKAWLFEFGVCALVLLLPLAIIPSPTDMFSLPKLIILRAITVLLLFGYCLTVVRKGKVTVIRTHLDLPILFFLLMASLSLLAGRHFRTSLYGLFGHREGFFSIVNYVLLYWLTVNLVRDKRQLHSLILVALLAGSLVSIYGILQHFGFDFFRWNEITDPGRSFSTIGQSVLLGGYLVLLLPVALAQILSIQRAWWFRVFASLSFALMLAALAFTYSRAAWLGFAGALFLLLLLARREFLRHRNILLLVALVLLVIVFLKVPSSVPYSYSVVARFVSIFKGGDPSAVGRLGLWKNILPFIVKRPLLGVGPGSFHLLYAGDDKAHNELLNIASTLGLLSLLAYLWVMVTFFWTASGAVKRIRDIDLGWLCAGLLAGSFGYLIHMQFSWSIVGVAAVFWMSVAMAVATMRMGVGLQGILVWNTQMFSQKAIRNLAYAAGTLVVLVYFVGLGRVFLAARHFDRGEMFDLNQASQSDQAILEYEKAKNLDLSEELYWRALGVAYLSRAASSQKLADYQSSLAVAIQSLERAVEINPYDELSHRYVGYAYQNGGERLRNPRLLVQAQSSFEEGLRLNPSSVESHFGLGRTLALLGFLDQAISEWQRTKQLDPRRIDAYYNLGWAYEKKGLRDKAVLEFQSALRLDPGNAAAEKALEKLE